MNNEDFIEGFHFYYENGLMVLTEKYHLERGYCCGNCCRHCPYNYEKVSEPERNQLSEKKGKKNDSKFLVLKRIFEKPLDLNGLLNIKFGLFGL